MIEKLDKIKKEIIQNVERFSDQAHQENRNLSTYYRRWLDRLEIIYQKLSPIAVENEYSDVMDEFEELIQELRFS